MGKRSDKKPPAVATSRRDERVVRTGAPTSPDTPSWRFSTVDRTGPFAWPESTDIEMQIVEKLRQFDSMRWHDIEGENHHSIDVGSLSRNARSRLSAINQDDVDEVFSFHFSGKRRIIGIRDRNVVKLLWWDPDHLVCPSTKKHT